MRQIPRNKCIWQKLIHNITSAYNSLFSKQTPSKTAKKSNPNFEYGTRKNRSDKKTSVPKKIWTSGERRNQRRQKQRRKKKKRRILITQ